MIAQKLINFFKILIGYDTLPIDSMQGLEICSQQESNCSPMDVVTANDIDFGRLGDLPEPPQDNNQVAAWYDTDL